MNHFYYFYVSLSSDEFLISILLFFLAQFQNGNQNNGQSTNAFTVAVAVTNVVADKRHSRHNDDATQWTKRSTLNGFWVTAKITKQTHDTLTYTNSQRSSEQTCSENRNHSFNSIFIAKWKKKMQRKNGLKSFSIRAIKETTEGANKNARNQKKKKKNKITKQMNLFNVKLMERRRPHTKAVDFNWKTIFILSLLFGQCLTADGNGKRGNRSSKIIHKMTIDNLTATTTTMPWTSKLISRLNATSSLTNDAIQSTKTTDTTTSTSTIPIEKYDALALIQSTKHVKLKLVRDQFRKFVDAFGVQLQNMTIDFDIVDGEFTLFVCSLFLLFLFTFLFLCFVQFQFQSLVVSIQLDMSRNRLSIEFSFVLFSFDVLFFLSRFQFSPCAQKINSAKRCGIWS